MIASEWDKFIDDDTAYQAQLINSINFGLWQYNINDHKIWWSAGIYTLLGYHISELPSSYEYVLTYLLHPDDKAKVINVITQAITNVGSFAFHLRLLNGKGEYGWYEASGKIQQDDHCQRIVGLLIDADGVKRKEAALQVSLDTLNDQNKRLQNFAYIVSHNLRSHTGNLQFMLDLYRSQTIEADRNEILQNIEAISKNLNSTIAHLNEIVQIQTQTNKETKEISFQSVFDHTIAVLENNISAVNATIEADFSECPCVNYVQAYLESIFLNMISNAVKYIHPERKPQLLCRSFITDQHTYLSFEDNGLGIDLNKYGSKLFGMYKTFHRNADSKGLGLFITRNQVEALGGKIEVESTINEGTKFIIRLN